MKHCKKEGLWSVQMHSRCKLGKEKEMAPISHLPKDSSKRPKGTSAYVFLLSVFAFQILILISCRRAVSRITGGENWGGPRKEGDRDRSMKARQIKVSRHRTG